MCLLALRGSKPSKPTVDFNLCGILSSSTSQRKLTLSEDQCPRQAMLQTGWKEREEPRPKLFGPAAQPAAERNHPSLIRTAACGQLSSASPTIDLQNIFSILRQTQVLRHSAGSSALNDVNYPATNDSNTPENSSEPSDTSLPCRSSSFKCKSAFISPRHRNSFLNTNCTSNW